MIHNKYFEIMKEFLKGYYKEIYGRSLIKKTNLSQKNIALTLGELENKGILKSRSIGSIKYYSLNFDNPLIKDYIFVFEQLRKIEFLEKNSRLIDFSKKIDSDIFCIFGSYAKGIWRKGSDLDIFIVGKYDSNKIKTLAKNYGYDVQVFGMSVRDFKKSINKKTVLIKEIIENHVFLKGTNKFLEIVLNG